MNLCDGYSSIYKYYLETAKRSDRKGAKRVLKTDVHNETGIYSVSIPLIPELNNLFEEVYAIEIDQEIINQAKNLGKAQVTCGTVEKLPYDNQFFDSVLDFSTIDHVSNYNAALLEYQRALKNGGFLSIVVWVTSETQTKVVGNQIYFEQNEFERCLGSIFNITSKIQLFNDSTNILLHYEAYNDRIAV